MKETETYTLSNTEQNSVDSVFAEHPELFHIVFDNLETIEFFSSIPLESGKYYRVTGMSEINTILRNNVLKPTEKNRSFFDRQILTQIAKNSQYTIAQLEEINSTDTDKIRELYRDFVQVPAIARGEISLSPRTKSNHGDIAFQKEGFFDNYDPTVVGSGYFGAPVLVGDEKKSLFLQGHHGSYEDKYNQEIEKNKPVVLRNGFELDKFEIWLYSKDKGWYLFPKNIPSILQQAKKLYSDYLSSQPHHYPLGSSEDLEEFKKFMEKLT